MEVGVVWKSVCDPSMCVSGMCTSCYGPIVYV